MLVARAATQFEDPLLIVMPTAAISRSDVVVHSGGQVALLPSAIGKTGYSDGDQTLAGLAEGRNAAQTPSLPLPIFA
jgi:hypothetical protein